MALFNKLFQPKRSIKSDRSQHFAFENDYIPFTFERTQVRILLFRECERRGRKLLYDSSYNQTDSIQQNEKKECKNHTPKIWQNNQDNECMKPNDFQNRYVEPDTTLLGEMIFGSVALNYNGMSCKIHVMKSPERLMCTKVYCNFTRKISSNEGSESSNGNTSVHSDGDLYSSSKLSPWPSYKRNSQFSIFTSKDDRLTVNCLNKNDSGFSSQPSSHSNISCQSSSYELWHRNDELFQSDLMYASSSHCGVDSGSFHLYPSQHYSSGFFDNQTSLPDIQARRKDSQISRSSVNSSISECLDHSDKHTGRRTKIGIAIIIDLGDTCTSSMMTFLLDHAVFIEGAIVKLKYAAHKALCSHQTFVCTMKLASSEVAQWLVDLLSSPRIRCPIWPNLSTCNQILTKRKLADVFVNDLCSLLSTMDTKDTYFFMSTLLTNILTFHLGWVNSVGASDNNSAYIQHYNPLQTQLREMYGVIGLPAQASRTIVYGKQNYLLVRKILTILTYFIRSVSVNKFEIEETCLSWENVDDLITDGRLQEKTLAFTDCIDQSTQGMASGDIEMKIFTGHKSTAVLKCVETSMFESQTNLFLRGEEELHETKISSEPMSSKSLAPVIDVAEDLLPNLNSDTTNLEEYIGICNPTKNENSSHLKVMEYKSSKAANDSSAVRRLTRVPTGGLLSNFIGANDQESSQSKNTLTKIVTTQFNNPNLNESNESGAKDNNNVVFILGDNEELVGLRDSNNRANTNNSLPSNDVDGQPNKDVNGIANVKIDDASLDEKNCCNKQLESCCECKSRCQHSSKKHSGVKFDFEKYPQIVTNYMKSKNLDLLDRDVIGKADSLKFVKSEESEAGSSIINLSKNCDTCQNCSFTAHGLQTPSNASELEYTSDIPDHEFQYAKECLISSDKSKTEEPKVFVKKKLSNTVVVNEIKEENLQIEEKPSESDMVTELPLNNISLLKPKDESHKNGYYDSLLGSVSDHYISDFVLQGGVGGLKSDWEKSLSQDLKLQPGTTCLLADIDEWSVRVFSSGGRVIGDMSTLVASMLDCIPQMCHAKVPSLQCLAFIESKLREICVRSKGLAQLLIDKDFCDMEYLTKTLDLEPNDVPLLLAIASTHTPQATLKYGISYT